MAKTLKFQNALLCEYVARGDGRKHTLVNVFSGDIIVSEFPAQLHFGIYMEYLTDTEGAKELQLDIKIDKKLFAKVQIVAKDLKIGTPSVIHIQALEFKTEKECIFSVFASSDDYKRTKIISKRIYKDIII